MNRSAKDGGRRDHDTGDAAARDRPTRSDPHCCATCVHVGTVLREGRVITICRRLGFDTRPEWRFDCWVPNERVRTRTGAKPQG